MKIKLKLGVRVGMGLVLAALLVGACGKATTSSGSNSNWLKPCETADDCGVGVECWCHVCAAPCVADATCEQLGATCRTGADAGCREPTVSAAICVASCESSVDCEASGPGFGCVNGACIATSDASSGGGGSGGSASVAGGEVGALAVGQGQRCLASHGRLYCWGANVHGEAGGTPLIESQVPHLLSEVRDVVEVAAAPYHTCARTSAGDVYCWGYNASGEIGGPSAAEGTCPDYVLDKQGDYPCQPTPTRVEAVSGARHIAVAAGRSCAVLGDDSVRCWGDVADIATWVAGAVAPEGLALGPSGACAITPEGMLSCSREALEIRALSGLDALVLSAGLGDEWFGCALDAAGDVHCWGDDSYGQLGQPAAAGTLTNPIDDISQVVAMGGGACALKSDGSVWCWGRNSDGEVGRTPQASPPCGTETCESAPRRVENLPPAVKLAAGGAGACAVAEDATVWCWGSDSWRTLGTPRRVPGPWEGDDAACATTAMSARQAVLDVFTTRNFQQCATDQDCTSVSLDLACLHTCESVPLTVADRSAVAAAIAEVELTYCGAAPASCAAHEVTCAATTDQDVCFQGECTRVNLQESGCADACSCLAERGAAIGVYRGDCAGPDLWVITSIACASCGPGGAWLVIGNRGDAEFSGPATLSFEPENPDDAGLVPAAQALELALAPGQVTKPMYVESRGEVTTRLRITGAGDCQPLNDNGSGVTFPAARSCQ